MRLHLIDGTFELFRAHFSMRPSHTAPDGTDKKATLGVVQSLLWLLDDSTENVTHLAVAFDNPIVCFRNKLFDGYKTDAGIPPELRSQFDAVEEAVAALGVTVWRMKEFEADDALATAAFQFSNQVEQVRILTPDKDLGQMLSGNKIVQVDRIRKKEITEHTLFADKQLKPHQIPDFLGLVGDTADGIPGLDGWGEKSAATVLGTYDSIEKIPDSVGQWSVKPRGAEKLSAVLARERSAAMLYKKLATLRTDVPLKETLDQLKYVGTPKETFEKWAQKIGSESVVTRVKQWRNA
jgi:5'-3' exonuclease